MDFCVTTLLLFCLIAFVTSADIFVSPFGSDSNSGTSGSPMKTLQGAMNAASAGDVIIMQVGLYTGGSNINVRVTKQVTIRGENADRVIFSCQNSLPNGMTLDADAKLKDFKVQFCSYGVVVGSGNVDITGIRFENNNYGLYSSNSRVGTITATTNDFVNNRFAFYVSSATKFDLVENFVKVGGNVGSVLSTSTFSCKENVFLNNSGSLAISGTSATIDQTIFEGNLMASASAPLTVSGGSIRITDSFFSDNSGKSAGAFYISNSATLSIEGTSFSSNNGDVSGAINCFSGSGNVFDSSFENNIGGTGGAFFCGSSCQLFFNGGEFKQNTPDWSSPTCRV